MPSDSSAPPAAGSSALDDPTLYAQEGDWVLLELPFRMMLEQLVRGRRVRFGKRAKHPVDVLIGMPYGARFSATASGLERIMTVPEVEGRAFDAAMLEPVAAADANAGDDHDGMRLPTRGFCICCCAQR